MRHIIDNLRANDVPHHRQPARQRKRQLHSVWTATAPPHPQESAATTRRTVTRKDRHSKRNPSPASDRIIEIATLPLTCALARWGFRFAGLLLRVNARPFRFISLLRVNASVFWQNGMEVRLSVITASRSTCAPTIHLVNDNPHAIDVPLHRQPARQRCAALSATRAPTKAAAPFRLDDNRIPSPARERSNNHGTP